MKPGPRGECYKPWGYGWRAGTSGGVVEKRRWGSKVEEG